MDIEFRDDYLLPTVRIQRIELKNFKNVRNGVVVFNCELKHIPENTESDILGIYGQNGSGKTSVIEAIAILKRALSGRKIPQRYSECVMNGAEYATLTFVFDFQYVDETHDYSRTITYSFNIESVPDEVEENTQDHVDEIPRYPNKVRIFDEKISASGFFNGIDVKKQDILTTSEGKYPIGPTRKLRYYVGANKDSLAVDLAVNKKTAQKDSMSFIFKDDTAELFYKNAEDHQYFEILYELHLFATNYLYAVDTRSSGMGAYYFLPINTRHGGIQVNLLATTRLTEVGFEILENYVNTINTVLPSLISNMELVLDYTDFVSNNKPGKEVKLLTKRNDLILPLRDESAGIIRLISVLALITAAFNDKSLTVAVDELDAGIYEYLLGEILSALETYGKGQFIFTSHNLRPLEVLKKESILFTTSNPDNRYIRLKGVGKTNNLRTLYLREILGNTQDEVIYDAAKRQRMIAAFMKAGVGFVEEES